MQELNEALFLWINAPADPNAVLLLIAKLLAQQVIWLVPIGLIAGWLRGSAQTRLLMLEATVSGLAGALLALLGLPMAWARIYLGVHFPLDMVGAALVAGLSAYLCLREERWLLAHVYQGADAAYRQLFAIPIWRGWVRR